MHAMKAKAIRTPRAMLVLPKRSSEAVFAIGDLTL
jgi:hypothetical protein